MNDLVTIPESELRELQARLQRAESACSQLQMFVVLAMRDTGRARYTISEIEQARANPWEIKVDQDKDTGTVTVSVLEQAPPPAAQVAHPSAVRAAQANGQPGTIRTMPRLAVVK